MNKLISIPSESREEYSVGNKIISWLHNIYPLLQNSRWGPAINVKEANVLDLLRSPLYVALTGKVRDSNLSIGELKNPLKPTLLEGLPKKIGNHVARKIKNKNAALLSNKPKKVSVVFWPWQDTHIKAQFPVANVLSKAGIENSFLANRQEIYYQIYDKGKHTVFAPAIWGKLIREGRINGKREAQRLSSDPGIDFPPFPGKCSKRELINIIRKILKISLPVIHEMVATTNAIADEMVPKILVVGNDLTMVGRTGCFHGRFRGMRTACLMHGNSSGDPLQGGHIVDRFLVYGNSSYNQLREIGLPQSQVAICGAPHLDNKAYQSGSIHPTIQRKLGLGTKKMVLVATSGPGHKTSLIHHYKTIKEVMSISCKYNNLFFVAKLHKKDRKKYYSEIRRVIPESRLHIVPYGTTGFPEDIFDWLQGCSMVLTGVSSVAIDAMLMDVPVITMDFKGDFKEVNFIKAGATINVTSSEELEGAINRVVNEEDGLANIRKKSRGFLEDNFYALDGRAAWRAADIIRQMI